jgi:hypothetical protein
VTGLHQHPQPDTLLFRRAAGEGVGVGGWEAPSVRGTESRVGLGDSAKDPARRGLAPRPDPRNHLNFRTLRRHEPP